MPILHDVRLAFRVFRRTPVPTGIAVLSIALGVGATAVVFAAIKSVLLDPLPYAQSDRLVQLRSEFPKMQQQSEGDWVLWNDIRQMGRGTRTVGPLGAYGNAVFDLSGNAGATPEALYGVRVNADLFPVLGVSPVLGRNIVPEEDRPGHPTVMILSHCLWTRRFHSDPAVVGQTVTVNGQPCKVIGVMGAQFNFPMRRAAAHTPSPYVEFWAAPFPVPSNPEAGFGAVARLRPGSSLAAAREEFAATSSALARDFPALNRDRILTVSRIRDRTVGSASQGLALLMAAAVLFMLMGCANVANLLLATGLARQQEIAIKLAMGAGHSRIVRQLLTESCALAILGGLGAYALTVLAWWILPSVAPVNVPRLAAARADSSIFEFAVAVAVLNGILFGLAPALRMAGSVWSGLGVRGIETGGRNRLRSSLLVAEVAIAVLLVVLGGQVLTSFARLLMTDPGFQADRVLASVVLAAPERYPTPEQREIFYQKILTAVRALPGVDSAGTVDALPFSGENHGGFVSSDGPSSHAGLVAEIDAAGGQYLQTMGVRLDAGRWFRDQDMNPSANSAIVNEFLARRLWPAKAAVGQRLCVNCMPDQPANWKQVIGVVQSASHAALDEPEKGNVYLAAGALRQAVFLVVRTERNQHEMEQSVRRAIATIDPNQPVFLSASMHDLISDSIAERRFIMILLGVTGCLALLISAAGVYGVTSYTTTRRTPEIAVRMAVGASPANIFSLILGQSFRTVALGLALGLGAAFLFGKLLSGSLAPAAPDSAGSMWIAALVVTGVTGIACWIPSRRATKTDPMTALRRI